MDKVYVKKDSWEKFKEKLVPWYDTTHLNYDGSFCRIETLYDEEICITAVDSEYKIEILGLSLFYKTLTIEDDYTVKDGSFTKITLMNEKFNGKSYDFYTVAILCVDPVPYEEYTATTYRPIRYMIDNGLTYDQARRYCKNTNGQSMEKIAAEEKVSKATIQVSIAQARKKFLKKDDKDLAADNISKEPIKRGKITYSFHQDYIHAEDDSGNETDIAGNNPLEDWIDILSGADPIIDGWEDGIGNMVSSFFQ